MSEAMEKLVEALQDDLDSHRKLAEVLENKLNAMSCRDISRLEALGITEQQLVSSITVNERKRSAATHRATEAYYPQRRGRVASARELAQKTGEPLRGKVLALSALLSEVIEKVRRLNRINMSATQKILGHVDYVFQIIAQSGCDIGIYGRAGEKSFLEQNRLVDAMA